MFAETTAAQAREVAGLLGIDDPGALEPIRHLADAERILADPEAPFDARQVADAIRADLLRGMI